MGAANPCVPIVSGKLCEINEARFFFGVWRSTTFCGFQSGALRDGRSQSLCSHCVGKVMGNKKSSLLFWSLAKYNFLWFSKRSFEGWAQPIPVFPLCRESYGK
jgi:hypothetical protein